MKKQFYRRLPIIMVLLAFFFSVHTNAQNDVTPSSDPLENMNKVVHDENGESLYRIRQAYDDVGYIFRIVLWKLPAIITDSKTGLQWTRSGGGRGFKINWYTAQEFLIEHPEGWRLPTIEELTELYNNRYRVGSGDKGNIYTSNEHGDEQVYMFSMNTRVRSDSEVLSLADKRDKAVEKQYQLYVRGATSLPSKEYAIKIYSTPERVVPDGESTVEITAILYEYTGGNPAERLPGKTINFVLDEYSEFKAGKLSATTVVTDANGQAKVIFTAPTGERLQEAPLLKTTSTVNAVCEEFGAEDKAYISYILDDGKVMVEPTPAVISSEGLVPPDKRFPAVIRAHFEDDRLNSLTNTKVRFWIDERSPVGMLRGPGGTEGTELELITDKQGFAEVQYYYAADKEFIRPITESIKITSEQMATPMEARITVGMNIIFDLVENAYEGKGELNAGEKIPIRVKIKLAEYPNLDLSAFLNYWARNEENGDELLVKLEIDKISTVPTYLIQRLSLEDPPEPGFSENMTVRSFKDKGELNYLMVPYSSLEGYIGYPKISPQTIGTHYYEAHLTLTDQDGKAIFEADHPARTAFFNIETGMSTDLGQIFYLSNPFKLDSKEDKLCGAALGVMGMGTIMSVNDALHLINTGDVDGLYGILFSEVKGGILDKVKVGDAYRELAVDLYTGMALAENVGLTIMKDQTGPITAFEGAIFDQLKSAFEWEPNQVVIMKGYGDQKLFAVSSPSEEEKNAEKSNFAIAVGATVDNPEEINTHPPDREIPTKEGEYLNDKELNTTSLKNRYTSVYIIPADMKVRAENAIEMKRY